VKRFRFDPGALAEYQAAVRWYDENSAVGPAFVAAVEDAVKRIRRAPRSYARWRGIEHHEIRRCVVRRFPFVVFYRVESAMLTIIAVAHSHREPGYWTKRSAR
jgi:plasmid stabilization system protein ParE